jgi:type I restriction enzyme M protein
MPSPISPDFQELLFDRIPQKQVFEENLWAAADQLRAKARLKSSEYAAPLLGLFFLRYASNRFDALAPVATAEFDAGQGRRNAESLEDIYLRLCGFYLPEAARFQTLIGLSGKDNAQQSVVDAMAAFEEANPKAFGDTGIELPKNDYYKIPDPTLRGIITQISTLKVAEGDAFGKIYEYFLGKFALSEGQKGGEFYTPTSVVKLIVEVLEPHDGRIFDPACGTGGMFVQSAKFIQKHADVPHISIYGQEKVKETTNLSKLNLFVNGLKGDIRNIDSSLASAAYTEGYADTPGKFDFVMANPPFNVDGVQVDEVKDSELFTRYGLPVSAAKSGKKADALSNANYLWVSLFATALKPDGRAGFVMANSASDARGGELDVRKNLVDSGIVDVMVTISSNFFYTVTLPVTLWFFDKAKTDPTHPRHDQTLFIDARKIFYQTSRSTRAFTQAQLMNITAIVWLYRGETDKFTDLRSQYEQALQQWQDGPVKTLDSESDKLYSGLITHRERTAVAFQRLGNGLQIWFNTVEMMLSDDARSALANNTTWAETIDALINVTADDLTDKAASQAWYKRADETVTYADKTLRPEKDKTFTKADIRGLLRTLASERDDLQFVLERITYFTQQIHWLDDHFPEGQFRDVEGLCKVASREAIAEQAYSLNPGRYVGVSLEDDGRTVEEFQEFIKAQTDTLATLHLEADTIQQQIADDVKLLFLDVNVSEEV